MFETNNVLLVNEQDQPIEEMEKLVAQYQDHLHRALSVFILNEQGELLPQIRAAEKYLN
jgi:isopentenyldiphosphate isomerase